MLADRRGRRPQPCEAFCWAKTSPERGGLRNFGANRTLTQAQNSINTQYKYNADNELFDVMLESGQQTYFQSETLPVWRAWQFGIPEYELRSIGSPIADGIRSFSDGVGRNLNSDLAKAIFYIMSN